jgi:hypothetical protein
MMMGRFEDLLLGKQINSLEGSVPMPLKRRNRKKLLAPELAKQINGEQYTKGFERTIIHEIGRDPEAAEYVIRLTEPGLGVLFHT